MSTFGKREGGGRRSAARSAAPLIGLITTLDGTRSAAIIDVSATGARLRGKDLPPRWSDFFLNVDGIVTFGTVQWEDGDDRGIAFDVPLGREDEELFKKKVAATRGMPSDLRAAFEQWVLGVAR